MTTEPQNLETIFDRLLEPAATLAAAPLLALAVGVILFLICDIVDALRPARALAFAGSIVVALIFEVRILTSPPGVVLDGTYVADAASALWGMIFLIGTLLSWAMARGYYREDLPFKPEHDALMLSSCAGMILMAGAGDLIVFFIGLELLSIPLYALAAFQRSRIESVEAGLKYFLLGAFSSAIFLFGAALLYYATHTLDLSELVAAGFTSNLAHTGAALIAASLFFKVSVFPFHLWVPDVYQGSPTPVTALMAAGTKAAAFAFLVRISGLFAGEVATLVALIALVTMALGNLGALVQTDLKRLLAYSSVAHAGTLLLVVVAAMAGTEGESAMGAALYYSGAYLFTVVGAFTLVSQVEARSASCELDRIRGLGRRHPALAGALSLFMLSLGGIPATGGFLGKWFVFSALVRAGYVGTAVVGALLSVVALAYYLRVIVRMWMEEPVGEPAPVARGTTHGLVLGTCCAFVLALGLFPQWFLGLLATAG